MTSAGRLDPQAGERLAVAIIAAASREYPHVLAQELCSDADVLPPRVLNPSFFGSYDWHSAVHCHWSLVRLLAAGLAGKASDAAQSLLEEHLCPERLAGELAFYSGPGGRVAERPYGWAWLVMLHAECERQARKTGPDSSVQSLESSVTRTTGPEGPVPGVPLGGPGPAVGPPGLPAAAGRWSRALRPLRDLLAARLIEYLSSRLAFPVRAGTHPNTAFALQLLHQAATAAEDAELSRAVAEAAVRWFAGDPPLPWLGPPSGNDFLDPPLVEAALMADVLSHDRFAAWTDQVCPPGTAPKWRPPAFRRDASEPGAVHLEGLLVSRAWCLDRLARALPPATPLGEAARSGRDEHLGAVAEIDPCDGFSRSHWLPTYLIYLDGWLAQSL